MSACQFLFSWNPVSCNPEAEGTRYQGPFRSVLEICNKYPLFFDGFNTDSGGNLPLIIKEIRSLVLLCVCVFFLKLVFPESVGSLHWGLGWGVELRKKMCIERPDLGASTVLFHYLICHEATQVL